MTSLRPDEIDLGPVRDCDIGFTVAIPNLKAVEASPLPLLTIADYWLPTGLVKVFIAFVIFSMFAILVVGRGRRPGWPLDVARQHPAVLRLAPES